MNKSVHSEKVLQNSVRKTSLTENCRLVDSKVPLMNFDVDFSVVCSTPNSFTLFAHESSLVNGNLVVKSLILDVHANIVNFLHVPSRQKASTLAGQYYVVAIDPATLRNIYQYSNSGCGLFAIEVKVPEQE